MNKQTILKELINVGRKLVKDGLVVASGGNISARCGDKVLIKARKYPLDSKSPESFVLMDMSGDCKAGEPSSEKYMHLACYTARPDVNAVIHLHPVFSTAVANSSIKMGQVSYELAACLASDLKKAVYKASGSKELAREISRVIKRCNAVLMPNHGIITVGKDIETAYQRAVACERACQTLIFSKLLGLSRFLPRKEALRIMRLYK